MDALFSSALETASVLLHDGWLGHPVWMWVAFFAIVLGIVAFDLGIVSRKPHEMGFRESLAYSILYIAIGTAFGLAVWFGIGKHSGEEYFTGYLIEKTLSLDNIFVMSVIFGFFAIPRKFQHRILFWGILGVIILRALMIGAGVAALHKFEWVLAVFAGFLVVTGAKMLFMSEEAPDIRTNPLLKVLRRFLNVTPVMYGSYFFVKQVDEKGGIATYATPCFLALILIETSDILFAIDSVPAILAITTDPFIVYTSNIFAILGLRALYFLLAAALAQFRYLRHALALLLIFIGGKVLAYELFGLPKLSAAVSLAVTMTMISGGILYSLIRSRVQSRNPGEDKAPSAV